MATRSDTEFTQVRPGRDTYSPIDRGYSTDVQRDSNRGGSAIDHKQDEELSDHSSYGRYRRDSMESEVSARLGTCSISRRSSDIHPDRTAVEHGRGYQSVDERMYRSRLSDSQSSMYREVKHFASEPEHDNDQLYNDQSRNIQSQRRNVMLDRCKPDVDFLKPAEMLSPVNKLDHSTVEVSEIQDFESSSTYVRSQSERGALSAALSPRKPLNSASDVCVSVGGVTSEDTCSYTSDKSDSLMPSLIKVPGHTPGGLSPRLSPSIKISDLESVGLTGLNKRPPGYGRGILGCLATSPALSCQSEPMIPGRGRGILSADITPKTNTGTSQCKAEITGSNTHSKQTLDFTTDHYFSHYFEDASPVKKEIKSEINVNSSRISSSDVDAFEHDQAVSIRHQRQTPKDLGARPKTANYNVSASMSEPGNVSGHDSSGSMSIISASMTGQIGFKKARIPKEASMGHKSASKKAVYRE